MDEVTDTQTYGYDTEVIVEIMGVDIHGDFATISYQFSFGDDDTTVRPREEIQQQHQSHVEAALEEAGYTLK